MYENKEMLTYNELEFAIFCIENIAIRLDVSGKKVYEALSKKSDIFVYLYY